MGPRASRVPVRRALVVNPEVPQVDVVRLVVLPRLADDLGPHLLDFGEGVQPAELLAGLIDLIRDGMILAIGNCGIYRESFGVRAEDTVWVSPDGPVPLTRHPKSLAV